MREDLIIAFAVMGICAVILALLVGWEIHRKRHTPITVQSIQKFVEETYPDQWSAYKKGVHEGYEQGLRDGQEIPDEST